MNPVLEFLESDLNTSVIVMKKVTAAALTVALACGVLIPDGFQEVTSCLEIAGKPSIFYDARKLVKTCWLVLGRVTPARILSSQFQHADHIPHSFTARGEAIGNLAAGTQSMPPRSICRLAKEFTTEVLVGNL